MEGRSLYFWDGHFRPNLPEADRESGYGVLLSIFCALPAVLCRYLQIVVAVGQCGDDEGKV